MTKADIIDRIASGTGLTKIETEAVVNGFLSIVVETLRNGEGIEIRGFGSFRVQHRAPRSARNPKTSEIIEVEERYAPIFRASREFREIINRAWKTREDSEGGSVTLE